MRISPSISILFACLLLAAQGLKATDVLSYHNDQQSTGQNLTETKLSPSNITVDTFKKRFATPVDGLVYAQPLYKAGVTIATGNNAGVHNMVFVATEHDSVYGLDAQSGAVLWKTSLLANGVAGATSITSVPSGDSSTDDLKPEIGITGTPVIDGTTNYLYVEANTKQLVNGDASNPHYAQTLYKIDLTTGAVANWVRIGDTRVDVNFNYSYRTDPNPGAVQDPYVSGTGDGAILVNGESRVYFNALRDFNRPGLLLAHGQIYIGFGSHGDIGPYHGWLLSYDENTLALTGVFNTTPNGSDGAIWQSGGIPALDADGYLYFETGNGTFDGGPDGNGGTAGLDGNGLPVNGNYGDSFLKLAVDPTVTGTNPNINGWGFRLVDYFCPFNQAALNSADVDLGSGGVLILPDGVGSTAHPHLLMGGGKEGKLYLIDRDNMGHYDSNTDHAVQTQGNALNGCLDTGAYYNGKVYYVGGYGDAGKAFTISGAAFSPNPEQTTPSSYAFPGSTPSISANGANNGVVWTLDKGTGELRANAADTFYTQLWTSNDAPGHRDQLGTVVKFTVPTVADGQVYVGTSTALVCYGPPDPPTAGPAAPTGLTATAVSGMEVELAWVDHANNEDGFSVEQSSDGVNFQQIAIVSVNSTGVAVTGLQVATQYYFRVRAFNSYNQTSYSAYSNVATAKTNPQPPALDFTAGFNSSAPLLNYVGSAQIGGDGSAQLTGGNADETGAVWTRHAQSIAAFTTTFTFQLTSPVADGFTFCLQRISNKVTGSNGAGLGYQGIRGSAALKFDIFPNESTTGLFHGGAQPGEGAASLDMSGDGIDLHSGDVFQVTLVYFNGMLEETVADTNTGASFSTSYKVNLPALVGSSTAYLGFTGGTGGQTAVQEILTWNYGVIPTHPPAVPTGVRAEAASGTQVNLSWKDNSSSEAGFVIERRVGRSGSFGVIAQVGAQTTAYMDSALTPDTTYYYRVLAMNGAGNSTPSATAAALTPVPPAAPTNARTTLVSATAVNLAWTNHARTATSYRVLREASTSGNFVVIGDHLSPRATTYKDVTVVSGTTYTYHVQCSNLGGYSDYAEVTVAVP